MLPTGNIKTAIPLRNQILKNGWRGCAICWSRTITQRLDFVDDFRGNLFSEEVFVFTPKGELKTLPYGATALDFAFEIHTQVGSKCIGAKVNNKLVPINYVLKNGDQIEILTSQKQKPHEDWLRFVVSSKAKARIKDELKEDKKKFAEEGKEIVIRKLRQRKEEPTQQLMEQMREYFKMPANFELYYQRGKWIYYLCRH